jgi:hypothetical protein
MGMAQRKRSYEFPALLFPDERASIEQALSRLGLPAQLEAWNPFRWEVLDWFVRLAERDLAAMSPGDWQNFSEEVRTLKVLLNVDVQAEMPTLDVLPPFQDQIRAALVDLVDNKRIELGPFQITTIIQRPLAEEPKLPSGHDKFFRLGASIALFQGVRSVDIPPGGLEGLRYHLSRLLQKYPDTVQRCPHCRRLFARFRKHAQYCSRECQSVAIMRKRRPATLKKKRHKVPK